MGHMKKYKCPTCLTTTSVIRYGYRKRVIRLFCKACEKSFSVDPYFLDKKAIMNDHLDGLSFRKLGVKYRISKSHAWNIVNEELSKLPNNNQFTHLYCNRFSHVLVVDGKYFHVVNSEYDWVLLWGIDYFRHDIPVFTIAPSENYQSWRKYFAYFRILETYPQLLVCDYNPNIKLAARSAFPEVRIQTCFNHFKETIRRNLRVRSDPTYIPFVRRIEEVLTQKLNDEAMNKKLFAFYRDYQHNPVYIAVLTNIERYKTELLSYRHIRQSPVTTNLMEGMNAHLEARLRLLRSFQTVSHARLLMNGYILKRRFTKFTDCRGKFRFLRGKTGVQMTQKQEIILPTYF